MSVIKTFFSANRYALRAWKRNTITKKPTGLIARANQSRRNLKPNRKKPCNAPIVILRFRIARPSMTNKNFSATKNTANCIKRRIIRKKNNLGKLYSSALHRVSEKSRNKCMLHIPVQWNLDAVTTVGRNFYKEINRICPRLCIAIVPYPLFVNTRCQDMTPDAANHSAPPLPSLNKYRFNCISSLITWSMSAFSPSCR